MLKSAASVWCHVCPDSSWGGAGMRPLGSFSRQLGCPSKRAPWQAAQLFSYMRFPAETCETLSGSARDVALVILNVMIAPTRKSNAPASNPMPILLAVLGFTDWRMRSIEDRTIVREGCRCHAPDNWYPYERFQIPEDPHKNPEVVPKGRARSRLVVR